MHALRTSARRVTRINVGPAAAFTLVELLVVMAVIGILAGLLLPVLGRARGRALDAACRSNLRQQQAAWQMYTDENNDCLPPNHSFYSLSGPGAAPEPVTDPPGASWCLGVAPLDTTISNVAQGVLFPFNRNAGIYHCPADRSQVTGQAGLARTRSYCMNISLNCQDATGSFLKLAHILDPAPARLFVLIDTHEADIWDPTFGSFSADSDYAGYWLDWPSDRHQQGANLSLADGHVEHWTWKSPKRFTARWAVPTDAADAADLRRLQAGAKLGLD